MSRLLVVALLPLVGGGLPANACTMAFPSYRVNPNFSVQVEVEKGKPAPGVTVTVYGDSPQARDHESVIVAVARTGERGTAAFRNLPQGHYFVTTKRADWEGASAELDISTGTPAEPIVHLDWPQVKAMSLRELRGVILADQQMVPAPNVRLSLTEVESEHKLASIVTGSRGEFDFGALEPGYYVLSVNGRSTRCESEFCELDGKVLIEVKASAALLMFPRLGLFETSCGLMGYGENSEMVGLQD